MSGSGLPEPESDAPEPRRQKVTGAWAGYLIFTLILLVLIVVDAQAAYDREWAHVAGITVFTLAFLVIPTGGLQWLRRFWQARYPRGHPGYRR